MRHTLTAATAGALLALGATSCATDTAQPAQPAPADQASQADQPAEPKGPGKWEQTWPANYSDTTCRQWERRMDSHERRVAAADMLVGARAMHDPTEGQDLPADDVVAELVDGITTVCEVAPGQPITDTAAGVVLTEADTFL